MTSAELRRIVGAMTERPWRNGADLSHFDAPEVTDGRTFAYHVTNDADAVAIATLANHAAALVELVRACERLAEYELQGMDLGVGARGAVLAMRDALAAVHAIPDANNPNER